VQQSALASVYEDVVPEHAPASTTILGIPISVVEEAELMTAVQQAVREREPTVFVGLYAALFRSYENDPVQAELIRASVTYPDGAGVVRELHKRGVLEATRLATTDVMEPLAQLASRMQWRVGMYGAAPGVAERAAAALAEIAPGIEVVAIWDGYDSEPSPSELRLRRLDVLLIGLGAGRQEDWAYQVAVRAGVPAILTCGGLFDFLAGDKRRAPEWMQRAGLEWAFRVLLEPRRLFARYLLGNLYFLGRARAERRRASREIPAGEVQPWPDASRPSFAGRQEHSSGSAVRGTASVTRI
jgi:N-acetylglucosaminyldiphosphoundecaprenol N-acetyl-beta-D-mannosaminyltransferase